MLSARLIRLNRVDSAGDIPSPVIERGGGGDEDRDEIREQLEAVVGDPPVLRRPLQRQVLNQHGEGIGKDRRAGRHNPAPLASGEQEHVEDETVQEPEGIGTEMPPAGQANGVPDPRETDLSGQADRVLLRGPQRLGRHRLLDTEPVFSRCTVPGPVETRMVGENLYSRPDDEDHQEQVEEVLHADPDGKARVRLRVGRCDGAGMPGDEALDRRDRAQTLRGRHRNDEDHETDRKQPEETEPPIAADTDTRRDPLRLGDRPGPRRRIDDILAHRELRPKASHDLRRSWRRGRVRGFKHRLQISPGRYATGGAGSQWCFCTARLSSVIHPRPRLTFELTTLPPDVVPGDRGIVVADEAGEAATDRRQVAHRRCPARCHSAVVCADCQVRSPLASSSIRDIHRATTRVETHGFM